MDQLVAVLMTWIVAATGLSMPKPPDVVILPEAQIVEKFVGPDHKVWPRLRGLYDHESRKIYLPDTFNSNDLADKSTLLHELVHHIQVASNIQVPCVAAYEPMAYELQLRWLKEQGVNDPYAFIGTNELAIMFRSRCPEWE